MALPSSRGREPPPRAPLADPPRRNPRHGLGRGVGPRVSGVKSKDLDAAAKRVAFLIARSIGRKGTPGLRPFRKAGAYIQPKLEAIFRRHLSRVIGERGKGAP